MSICYIVGAGSLSSADLPAERAPEDLLIAADAGYRALQAAGIKPDLIIGDFDSMPPVAGENVITLPVEKDDTDVGYAVKEGLRRGFRRFVICGGLGGKRLSHTLANLQLLSFIRQQGGRGELVWGGIRAFLVANETRAFPAEQRGIVSLFALQGPAVVTLTGLHYPLTRGTLQPGFPLGVSNHFTGTPATVTVHSGVVLAVLEEE